MTTNRRLYGEIKEYFGNPGFARFLQQLQKRYEASSSGARGYIILEDITESERRTIDGFYRTYSPSLLKETKRYSIKKFERLLKDSRFSLTLVELLEIMSGENVRTRQEIKALVGADWEQFIQRVIEKWDDSLIQTECAGILAWTKGLLNETSPGSRTLRKLFAASREEAELSLSYGVRALIVLKQGNNQLPVRLPVLAARITGDSHALDWKYPLGRLFWWGLTAIHQDQIALSEEEATVDDSTITQNLSHAILLREGYRRGRIADDDLSSQVMLFAPVLFGVWEERILTLRQVERLAERQTQNLRVDKIFVVENPSIFAELVEAVLSRMKDLDAYQTGDAAETVIICGNGQPTVAVIRLLDWLCGNSKVIILQYAGDLDGKGLSIAQGLQVRYPSNFLAWRMDKEQVIRYADQGLQLSEVEKTRFRYSDFIWDHELGHTIAEMGVKLHQELWMEELVRDFLQKK
jgi:uncharacterized protein (TIGR02679 family)